MRADKEAVSHSADLAMFMNYLFDKHIATDALFATQVVGLTQSVALGQKRKEGRQLAMSEDAARLELSRLTEESAWGKSKTWKNEELKLRESMQSCWNSLCLQNSSRTNEWKLLKNYAEAIFERDFAGYSTYNNLLNGTRTEKSNKPIAFRHVEVMRSYMQEISKAQDRLRMEFVAEDDTNKGATGEAIVATAASATTDQTIMEEAV